MRLFLDANVLVSVLNKEYPVYPYTARVLSLAGSKKYSLATSSVCLAIAYYFAEKKHGYTEAKKKIAILLEHIDVTDCGKKEAMLAAQNEKIHDFENGLQYYSALNAKCNCIITQDVEDFYFSELDIFEPEVFLRKHIK